MLAYRKDIDGLRALAVLFVVFFHAYPQWVPGGFIGVDIFFVLSGFLISSILFHELSLNQFRFSTFYIRRIKRIFPALVLVLLTALIVGYFLLLSDEYKNLGKHLAGSALFINNFLLWKESGYFDVASDLKPLLHLWSLGIEEQFYIFWPFIVYFTWIKGLKMLGMIALLVSVSLVWCVLRTPHHGISSFYLPFSRFWELASGGGLAFLVFSQPVSRWRIKPVTYQLLAVLGLAGLFGSLLMITRAMPYPGWAALVPTGCTLLLLITTQSWINRRVLAHPVLIGIGLISYPLYLWHWFLFSSARIIMANQVPGWLMGIFIVLSMLLAWGTYQFIEKPIRFSTTRLPIKQGQLAISLSLALLLVGGSGLLVFANNGLEHRPMVMARQTFQQDLTEFDQYRQAVSACNVHDERMNNISWCLQSRPGLPTKVIWGDSHADHLFPGIARQDQVNNWLLLGQSACPPALGVAAYWVGNKDQCRDKNQSIIDAIVKMDSVDTVVLASLGPFYISNQGYAAQHQGQDSPARFVLASSTALTTKQAILLDGFERSISKLEAAGKRVILFQDVPELPFMPTRCLNRPLAGKMPCELSRKEVLTRQHRYAEMLRTLKKRHPSLLVYDPTPLICQHKQCPLMYNHHLIYRDSNHLSRAGSDWIAGHFIGWFASQA